MSKKQLKKGGKSTQKQQQIKQVATTLTTSKDFKGYIDYKTIFDVYGLSEYKIRELVKKNKVQSITGDKSKKLFLESDIKNHISKIEATHRINKESESDSEKQGLENYLVSMQQYFGGSSANCNWCLDNPIQWGEFDIHSNKWINENIFFDTIIFSVPVLVIATNEGERFAINKDSQNTANNYCGYYFSNIIPHWSTDYHTLTITDMLYGSDSKLNKDNKQAIVTRKGKTDLSDLCLIEGEKYLAYQNYRYSVSNAPFKQILTVIRDIQNNPKTMYNHPVLVTRYDITTNLKGAVKPYSQAKDLQMYGLIAKTNKHYVSETAHTYIFMDKDKSDLDVNLNNRDSLISLKQFNIINRQLKAIELTYSNFLLDFLKVESLSSQQQLIETKIYDKLRFMLECGSVANSITGFKPLQNLVDSDKIEIRKAFTDNSDVGISRIETRIRGLATLTKLSQQFKIHRHFCKILSTTYSNKTPFQYSIDSFFNTIRACVGVIIDNGENCNSEYGVSQWVNHITKRLQGKITQKEGEKISFGDTDFNNWCMYQSNRHVPLVIIEVENKDTTKPKKGDYKITLVRVISPTLEGFSNIIEVKNNPSSNKNSDRDFMGFTMPPFKSSSINAKARDITKSKDFLNLYTALEYVKDIHRKFKHRLKITNLAKSEVIPTEYQQVLELFNTHLDTKKRINNFQINKKADSDNGYIIERENKYYLARLISGVGGGVKVYNLKIDKDTFDKYKSKKVRVTFIIKKGKQELIFSVM